MISFTCAAWASHNAPFTIPLAVLDLNPCIARACGSHWATLLFILESDRRPQFR